jgi:hypothetical protein
MEKKNARKLPYKMPIRGDLAVKQDISCFQKLIILVFQQAGAFEILLPS